MAEVPQGFPDMCSTQLRCTRTAMNRILKLQQRYCRAKILAYIVGIFLQSITCTL